MSFFVESVFTSSVLVPSVLAWDVFDVSLSEVAGFGRTGRVRPREFRVVVAGLEGRFFAAVAFFGASVSSDGFSVAATDLGSVFTAGVSTAGSAIVAPTDDRRLPSRRISVAPVGSLFSATGIPQRGFYQRPERNRRKDVHIAI